MQRTGIDYLTHTWNPLAMRCTPISEGCRNCWHIRMAKRHAANPHFTEDERAAYAGHNIVLREKELEAPLKLRKPARIGVQFMGDLFLEGVGLHWAADVWRTMADSPRHTYLVLTKRPKNMLAYIRPLVQTFGVLPNVFLGVTAENQQHADERIPLLLQCPAAVRFVSIEPMLAPVKLFCFGSPTWGKLPPGSFLNWVIVGSESGPGARPMENDWARSIRDQCKAANTAFFMKQISGKGEIPEDLMIREYPGAKHFPPEDELPF